MRGRKPKPVEQRIREGNPGKRPLPEPIKLRGASALEKPDDLPARAAGLWDELVPVLEQAGLLNRIDEAALTALCLQWQRACDARTVVEQEGLVAIGSHGQLIEHPMLAAERAAHQLLLRYAEQYGITPVARARIALVARQMTSMADELDELEQQAAKPARKRPPARKKTAAAG